MRKSAFIFIALSLLVIIPAFLCCSSSPKSETAAPAVKQRDGETVVYLYDNCPTDSSAKIARLILKSSNKKYTGVTSFSYTGYATKDDLAEIKKYIQNCKTVKNSIEESKGLCKLSFNTNKNGDGLTLDLSSDENIIASLITMKRSQMSEIFAIYNY